LGDGMRIAGGAWAAGDVIGAEQQRVTEHCLVRFELPPLAKATSVGDGNFTCYEEWNHSNIH
jgi:hypothetical protein